MNADVSPVKKDAFPANHVSFQESKCQRLLTNTATTPLDIPRHPVIPVEVNGVLGCETAMFRGSKHHTFLGFRCLDV